jgi:hypothetical protein
MATRTDFETVVNQTISETIEKLITLRGMRRSEFWGSIGLTRSAYYARTGGVTRWGVADVKRAADALGVSVATLYDGLDLAALGLPHLDSNQKPADYQPQGEGMIFPFPRSPGTTVETREARILDGPWVTA